MKEVKKVLALIVIGVMLLGLYTPISAEPLNEDPESTAGYVNIAAGKAVTMEMDSFDQNHFNRETAILSRLTDGNVGTGDWKNGRDFYVDFYRNVGRDLIVDLEGTYTIREINLRVMEDFSAGIYAAEEVSFAVSTDGGATWSTIGSVERANVEAVDEKHMLYKVGNINYGANKIKISFPVDVWIFTDELQILGEPAKVLDTSNIAVSKPVTMEMHSFDQNHFNRESAILGRLTDENVGAGDWQNGRDSYVDFYRNVGRDLIVDLQGTYAICEINLRAMEDFSAGIYAPEKVSFAVSADNGETWSTLGSMERANVESVDEKHRLFKVNNLNYSANKIKISFPVDVWIFADELQVMGSTDITGTWNLPPASGGNNTEINQFPAPGSEQVRGTYHDYLAYCGYHTNGTVKHDKTYDLMLPTVAYVKNGEIKDWLFDSVTFLPYGTSSANRRYYYNYSNTQEQCANKDDWQEIIDTVFDPENQLAALNKAVGDAKAALNDPDYKVKVKFTIPMPLPQQSSFGEVNGIALNFDSNQVGNETALANRVTAVKWYIDQYLSKWDDAKYPNLRFDGFYWYSECLHTSMDSLEDEVIKQTTDYIHQQGKIIYWIPFYQASGFQKWKEIGFDWALMQPNYAFQNDAPVTRPTDAAELAKKFGLGVELEIHHNAIINDAYRAKFMDYLNQGITAGYMTDSVHAWYLANTTLNDAYNSGDIIYDYIYTFIKGSYPNMPDGKPISDLQNLASGKSIDRKVLVPYHPEFTEAQNASITNTQNTNETPEKLALLVDGEIGSDNLNDGKYVKFLRGGGRQIEIDLEGYQTVKSLNIIFGENTGWGVTGPEKASFMLSSDGGINWVEVGNVQKTAAEVTVCKPELGDKSPKIYKYEVKDLNYIANKVRIDFDVASWAFASELEVIGKTGIKDEAVEPPIAGLEDLALGKPVTKEILIAYHPEFTEAQNAAITNTQNTNETPENLALLVDGDLETSVWGDGKHVKMLRGGGRKIDIDLGESQTIKSLNMVIAEQDAAGVKLPEKVTFMLSNDGGKTWGTVGEVLKAEALPVAGQYKYEVKGLNLIANKVRVNFDVNVWVMPGEIQVMGKPGIQDGAEEVEPDYKNISSIAGINDINVIYGTSFDAIELPLDVQVTLSDGTNTTLQVTWDEGSYDGCKLGTYTLYGTLSLIDGVINSDDIKAVVNITVTENPDFKEFTITPVGTLDKTSYIKAVVNIKPTEGARKHAGNEVIIFQLMKGNNLESVFALEKDITSEETLTAFFNVPNYRNPTYTVKVFVCDEFSSDISGVTNLADQVILK